MVTNRDYEGPKALSSHPATRCVPDLHILVLSTCNGPGTKPDPGVHEGMFLPSQRGWMHSQVVGWVVSWGMFPADG